MTTVRPESLRPHYQSFLPQGRILLTGHSHQAWPDIARQGMLRAFDDAAAHVDDKWERAFQQAQRLREEIARRIGARPEEIALGASTHELVVRFLSALDLRRRPHLVTTTGEFHSLRRQLTRLQEAGLDVSFVPCQPVETLAQRLAEEVRPHTAALLVSTVLFETAAVVPYLSEAVSAAHHHGAEVLLDAYHGFTALPIAVGDWGERAFLVAGGYKYAQWGEGCCFLRVPADCALRPIVTGWFSDFGHLDAKPGEGRVVYGQSGAARFAGSTYDPVSHYRAVEVIRFFDQQQLQLSTLRALSVRQTQRIIDGLGELDLLTPRAPERRGGFVAYRVPNAPAVVQQLRDRGVLADARGEVLRLGPAPYVTDAEIDEALVQVRQLVAPGPSGYGT